MYLRENINGEVTICNSREELIGKGRCNHIISNRNVQGVKVDNNQYFDISSIKNDTIDNCKAKIESYANQIKFIKDEKLNNDIISYLQGE